ncbi:hypothetical protein FACS1894123_06720 [Bacteroidia bacterium]|nr:hypothetical protein FACS1894123_06720 [Bacteroidia bacterium]
MNFAYLSCPIESYLNKDAALDTVVSALDSGHLSILLGSGVSHSADDSFPSWTSLVERICKQSSVTFDNNKANDNSYLLKRAEKVKTQAPNEYLDYVEQALYKDVAYNNSVLKKDLLIAIGSLIMISVSRNSKEFVNFNFDDLFEWYLEYYGNDIQIVSNPITLLGNTTSTIYHPHGFLPKEKKFINFKTKKILFSQNDYDVAMRLHSPWSTVLQRLFSSKLILMVGMSGEDAHFRTTCNFVYNDILEKKRPLGFLILPDNEESREDEDVNLQNGIVNLYLDLEKLPEIILEICRKAQKIN